MKALNHDSDTVLEMRNITKIYSNGFVANNDISSLSGEEKFTA